MSIIFLTIGGFFAWVLFVNIKQKFHDDIHRADIIKQQQIEYDESVARLKNINYLTVLAEYDKLAKVEG